MKFFLISDNVDTAVGLRLAGIEGVVVHTSQEVCDAMEQAISDPEVGLILMTSKLVGLCRAQVYEKKLTLSRPLIVEIPDRHGGNTGDAMLQYLREAIGVKL